MLTRCRFTKARFTGIRSFDLDDLVAVIAFGLYTGLCITLNYIATCGGSNLNIPDWTKLSAEEISSREYNSKIVVVSEQMMLNTIYSLKLCVLLFYLRITKGLPKQRMVQYVFASVIIGWLATQITFFTACRPFHGYWDIPVVHPQCVTLQTYGIVQGCFNIPTDAFMLFVTMSLVYRLQVPLKQKILIGGLFSLGIVVLLFAMIAKIENNIDVYSSDYMLWYIRESSVATYIANLPQIWPLLRQVFPCLKNASSYAYSGGNQYGAPNGTTIKSRIRGGDEAAIMKNHYNTNDIEMSSADGVQGILTTVEVTQADEKI
ncbi:hypothetical protein K461DRAFT_298736 [Myriangium duriaei CBS 260.36]|uniref:Rhodopsin domain-containing protein n=1 Tax=Myriangium duriaei CBS 260.36 TaxID=1168546 RepID=A0A9P4MKX1_9PEZI|nr:hypothetical protein K461DRAFT_298736 [Myriangium duriaei CBS 260.36]